jgi:glutamate racemase
MIAIYDSGIGGTSVLQAIRAAAPYADLLYLADQARCPYGQRSIADIRQIALGCARWMGQQGAAPIVVACNTASAAALADMRLAHPQVPFVGMVPAVKPAVQQTKNGVVGVMATAATLQGHLFHEVTTQYARHVHVVAQACPGLVEFVEAGDTTSSAVFDAVHHHLQPLQTAGADVVVLGCTHYPFLSEIIHRVAPHMTIIDPSAAVARQTLQVAQQAGFTVAEHGRIHYYTTGDPAHLSWQLNALQLPGGHVDFVTVEELL